MPTTSLVTFCSFLPFAQRLLPVITCIPNAKDVVWIAQCTFVSG